MRGILVRLNLVIFILLCLQATWVWGYRGYWWINAQFSCDTFEEVVEGVKQHSEGEWVVPMSSLSDQVLLSVKENTFAKAYPGTETTKDGILLKSIKKEHLDPKLSLRDCKASVFDKNGIDSEWAYTSLALVFIYALLISIGAFVLTGKFRFPIR